MGSAAVEVVLFDLDGTLLDSLDLIRASMRHATEVVLGAALADDVLMHNVGVPLFTQMREFDEERAEELVRVYRAHNAIVHDELIAAYPGVRAGLEALSAAGLRLGVVTSKASALAKRGIGHFELTEFFEVIVGSDDVTAHKPDPYPLLFAAEQMGAEPATCAYVGDSPHDMTAALAAGFTAVAATWGVASRERLMATGPHYSAASMTDVTRIFMGAGAGLSPHATEELASPWQP